MRVNSLLHNTVAASAESDIQLLYVVTQALRKGLICTLSFNDCFQLASSDAKINKLSHGICLISQTPKFALYSSSTILFPSLIDMRLVISSLTKSNLDHV